jgi:hypothetical protein
MGNRLFIPNPKKRRNYLRNHNLQCVERVDSSETT